MRLPASLALALVASLPSQPVEAKKPPTRSRSQRQAAPATPEPAIPPSSWLSLKNAWVEVSMADGRSIRGRLAGSDETTATVVSKSGEVVPISIREAASLKQIEPPPPPPPSQPLTLDSKDVARVSALELRYGAAYGEPKGKKMHTAGAVVLSVGLTEVVLAVGLGVAALLLDDAEVIGKASLGLLFTGAVTVAVGAPLAVKGKKRRLKYYDWLHQQEVRGQARIAPGYLPLRGGAGLSMRIAF